MKNPLGNKDFSEVLTTPQTFTTGSFGTTEAQLGKTLKFRG
jgi:hypothetical protein